MLIYFNDNIFSRVSQVITIHPYPYGIYVTMFMNLVGLQIQHHCLGEVQ
jgi:hypothetical protein